MLTEKWALDYDPVLPARWDPRMSPGPVTVYLDQWCYDHLARDRAGKPQDPREAGCFESFRRLALDGKAVLVLSQAHYRENWRRENEDARWDTAVVMAELTGFSTITPAGLAYWEALEAVAAYTGTDADVEPPQVFGWGIAHCLRGGEGSAMIIDIRTGRPASWDELPAQTRARMEELDRRSAERFELAVLARCDPRLEPGMMLPFAAVPDDGRGDLLVQEERGIRGAIDQEGENASKIRVIVEGRSFFDSTTWLNVNAACRALGLRPDAILNKFTKHTNGEENRRALSAFLACMPIQGRYAELRVQAHMQANRKRKASDGRDYFALASVSPFVDYLVTDKSMCLLAEAAGLQRRGGATIMRRLADLRERLELALGH